MSQPEPPSAVLEGELSPALAARAQEIDMKGEIPAELIAFLRDRGGLAAAEAWPEPRLSEVLEAIVEIARGSGALGWCLAWWARCRHQLDSWAGEVAAELVDGSALISGPAGDSVGQVETADGTVLLSGRWDLLVGADHVDWLLLPVIAPDGRAALTLLGRDECELGPASAPTGLRGACRWSAQADQLPVAGDRLLCTPAGAVDDAARFAETIRSAMLVAATIGIAKGAVDAFEGRLLSGTTNAGGAPLADIPTMQMRLAQADCQIECARDLLRSPSPGATETPAEAGPSAALRLGRNHAFATRLCVEAVGTLFDVVGASGLSLSAPMQRIHRDVNTSSQIDPLSWELGLRRFARVIGGLQAQTLVAAPPLSETSDKGGG